MKQLIFLSLIVLTFASCKYSYKSETINVNNQFTMSVPDYLKKCDDLKPGAEFQYKNRYRSTYALVFSDKKDKSFPEYYTEQITALKKAVDKPMVNDSVIINIPGATGVHTELAGKMQGEMIYYSVLTLETKDKYYQSCIWTRGEDRKLKYGKEIESMLLSFKLVNP